MRVESTVAPVLRRTWFRAAATKSVIRCLSLALLLSGGSLGAQALDSLAVGARIRVLARDSTKSTGGERQFVARFDGAERDSLMYRLYPVSDRFLFPLSAIKSIDVSVSHRSAGRGAWLGAGWGALLGTSVMAVYLARVSGRSCDGCLFSSEAGVLITGVPLTVVASGLGAIIFSRRQDKWRSVPLESLRTRR